MLYNFKHMYFTDKTLKGYHHNGNEQVLYTTESSRTRASPLDAV